MTPWRLIARHALASRARKTIGWLALKAPALLKLPRPVDGLTIFAYHQLTVPPFAQALRQQVDLTTAFEYQIRYLSSQFTIVELHEWLRTRQPERGAVAITFDDGYADVFTHAWPVLQRYGVRATVFLVPGAMDCCAPLWVDRIDYIVHETTVPQISLTITGQPVTLDFTSPQRRVSAAQYLRNKLKRIEDDERRSLIEQFQELSQVDSALAFGQRQLLSWDQVKTLHRQGVTFGSHSLTHPILTRLSPASLREELGVAKARIEAVIGEPITSLAYPNGGLEDFNPTVVHTARSLGYQYGVTFLPGRCLATTDPFAIPRYGIFTSNQNEFVGALLMTAWKRPQLKPYP